MTEEKVEWTNAFTEESMNEFSSWDHMGPHIASFLSVLPEVFVQRKSTTQFGITAQDSTFNRIRVLANCIGSSVIIGLHLNHKHKIKVV